MTVAWPSSNPRLFKRRAQPGDLDAQRRQFAVADVILGVDQKRSALLL